MNLRANQQQTIMEALKLFGLFLLLSFTLAFCNYDKDMVSKFNEPEEITAEPSYKAADSESVYLLEPISE